MNKNAVYVENQPKHSIASIILVNDPEITKEVHEAIDNLGKVTDLIFIFNDSMKGNIKIPTFTRLYSGSSYICGDSFCPTLLKTLEYCNEVFNKHCSFIITDTTRLSDIKITEDLLDKIYKITLSDIKSPILEKVRLGTDELREIYISSTGFFKKTDEWTRSFSTHRSNSKLLYLRRETTENILTLLADKKSMVSSFTENDISYFLTSILVRFGIDILSQSIENVKFNGENV